MAEERDRKITSIFHSAIEREPSARVHFLDGACAGDDDLRGEVEQLIKAHEEAGSFIDSPAYERGAGLIGSDGSLVGRSFGQYRLISLIGEGGMGAVYLADDTRLNRKVAIKVLPTSLTSDQAQVGRFQQEALAASALNHPNIITVYDINEADGTKYIATEFIDGVTLRKRFSRKSMSVSEALDVAIQIAGALGAAHVAGVVHRDIKPENIMLRPDGYVKVLDFGIAKLTEQRNLGSDGEAPTIAIVKTGKGVVMGTAHYMSPEQARGLKIDSKTDIWSLGVVLYEMLSGKLPFQGETVSDCIASILKSEPPRLPAQIPDKLDWIVQKALRKDPEERYQTAKEMLSDLRAAQNDVNARPLIEESSSNVLADNPAENTLPQASTTVRTTSSAEYIVTELKRHKLSALIAVLVVTGVVVGGIYAYSKYSNKPSTPQTFQSSQVNRITTSGRADDANISPDGRLVVYTENSENGDSSVLVKQLATGNTLTIVPPARVAHWGTVFSPDGDFVYYLMNDLSSEITSMYKVSSIGGTPQKILSDVDGCPAISPDGNQVAFVRDTNSIKSELVVANSNGTGERSIATYTGDTWLPDEGPSWSPDGKSVANMLGVSTASVGGSIEYSLMSYDVATGAGRELTPKKWKGYAGRVVWMPDARSLMMIAAGNDADRNQVWRVTLPDGTASQVTNDIISRDSRTLGVTADGKTLLTVTRQTLARIETLPPDGNMSQLRRLSSSEANEEGFNGLSWTPDGRIVFASSEGEQDDLWIMNADGSNRRRLTSDTFWDGYPAVTPDGRYVVFSTNRPRGGSTPYLYRIDIDGSNLTQLTSIEDTSPDISPDGKWVLYSSWSPGPKGITGQGLWRISIEGGKPIQLTEYNSQTPQFSPDGNWILATVLDDQVTPKRWRNGVIPISGGPPAKQFDRPNYRWAYARWTPDGKGISFIGAPAIPSNIWIQPVDGGEPRKLTNFTSDMIFRHAWSRDGKTLAIVHGRPSTDVVLMKDSDSSKP
jgi:serine/threonine protein kinase